MQARMPGASILSAGLGGKALPAVAGKSQAEAAWEKKGKLPGWQTVAADLPPEARPQQGFSAPVASMVAEPDCLGKAGNTAGVLEGHGGVFHLSRNGSGLEAGSRRIYSLRLRSFLPGSCLYAALFPSPV